MMTLEEESTPSTALPGHDRKDGCALEMDGMEESNVEGGLGDGGVGGGYATGRGTGREARRSAG